MAKTYLRKEIMLSADEVSLLRFAMKCTGLDMTSTMRLMIREAIIIMMQQHRETGIPKLPADLEKFVAEF